jgi:hypothetical protein
MKRFYRLCLLALTSCFSSYGQILINEVCASNADLIYDPKFYNFSGWVELYNGGAQSVDIGGYYLSDNPSNTTKWKFPPGTVIASKGYLLIWCDNMNTELHTNFTLDTRGETLVLSSSASSPLDQVVFPKQYLNVSYGRLPDGASITGFLTVATPGAANAGTQPRWQLEPPTFSVAEGRYAGEQSVVLSQNEPGVVIRYTTDGSEPSASSAVYASALSIQKTMTVKAKAYLDNFIPSNTITKTYFIGEHPFTIPVVSLSTNPSYLWDNTIGIYTDGTNGIPGNCQDVNYNWNRDWDRHSVVEYFKTTGEKQFDDAVDIRIGGACSRALPQKTFAVKARTKYGTNTINQKLFDKDIQKFGGVFLRNSGNDFNMTSFRDALLQLLPKGQMDVDYMSYQPSALYINGVYWGIQSLREKIDADFIQSNYGIPSSDLDLIETYGNALEGTPDAYAQYLDSLQKINLALPASFNFINRHIDVQEYINYLASEIYYANTDWPGNNIKLWRQRSTNGKFRWIFWDTDFGFGLYDWASYATHPTLTFATDPNSGVDWPNPPWSTLHIRLVLQNPVFRNRFIQTLTTAMNTTFKPDRVIRLIDSLQNQLAAEMPYHKQRWGGTMEDWNNQVQRLRDFATARNDFMKQHVSDFFGLTEQVAISIRCSPSPSGSYQLNGVVSSQPLTNGSYYKDLPFQVSAVPTPGFAFKNWKITKAQTTKIPLVKKGDTWNYFDKGTSPGGTWPALNFDDGSWASGPAQLGYGDGDEKTVVSFGPDTNNKYITTYFRKTFSLADTIGLGSIQASILFDDAAVVYLNGVEVYRNNLPAGTINFTTPALTVVADENAYHAFTIPKGMVLPGQNVVAVEIHQSSGQSSDISFDLEMKSVKTGSQTVTTTTSLAIADTAYTDVILEAFFEPVDNQVKGIVVNELSSSKSNVRDEFNETDDWIELYNAGTKAVDLAGLYITDDTWLKTKHRLLAGSGTEMVVAPGHYKVLWADGQVEQGAAHLSFKLSSDGEEVGLYQVLNSEVLPLDEVSFDAQPDYSSLSRIPNGSGPIVLTSFLTPNAENKFGVYTGIEEPAADFLVYPNPTSENIYIQSNEELDEISVYDALGREVWRTEDRSSGSAINLGNIPSGLYVLRARSGYNLRTARIIKL